MYFPIIYKKNYLYKLYNSILCICRPLTMDQILNIVENENDPADIYIEPPKVHELTDEDSADENSATHAGPDNLSGNQLRAAAEVKIRHTARDSLEDEDNVTEGPRKKNKKESTSKKKAPNVTRKCKCCFNISRSRIYKVSRFDSRDVI